MTEASRCRHHSCDKAVAQSRFRDHESRTAQIRDKAREHSQVLQPTNNGQHYGSQDHDHAERDEFSHVPGLAPLRRR